MSPSISKSTGNQTIKIVQLIEFNVRIIFFKNHGESEAGRLVRDLFDFLKNKDVKASDKHLSCHSP